MAQPPRGGPAPPPDRKTGPSAVPAAAGSIRGGTASSAGPAAAGPISAPEGDSSSSDGSDGDSDSDPECGSLLEDVTFPALTSAVRGIYTAIAAGAPSSQGVARKLAAQRIIGEEEWRRLPAC